MVEERTQPKTFHIHIDAQEMPPDLDAYVKEHLGFYDHHFTGHPEGYKHFEPTFHLTRKIEDGREFQKVWKQLEHVVEGSGFVGYLEGEFIPVDQTLSEKRYDDSTPFPFKVERRRLRDEESFRETEFHLVMDGDKSDSRLVKKLLDSGLYGAFLDKPDHRALVLTMQGYRRDIRPLIRSLDFYLRKAGGVVRGTIKEERAIRHKLFGITPQDLPEIADNIQYL